MNKINELLITLSKKFDKGNCWFFHDWSKWEQYKIEMLYTNWVIGMDKPHESKGIEDFQRRYCLRCNFKQIKKTL